MENEGNEHSGKANTITIPRTYCVAVARAIYELDQYSLRGPQTRQDKQDWNEARKLLVGILDRNGYEFTECDSKRIRETKGQKQ